MEMQEAAAWAAEEFEKRTKALAAGEQNINWALPESRVCWSEVATHMNGETNRNDFQQLFETEIKKRKLFRVLRGKITAEDWMRKHG